MDEIMALGLVTFCGVVVTGLFVRLRQLNALEIERQEAYRAEMILRRLTQAPLE